MLRLIFFFSIVINLSACSNSTKRRNTPYNTSTSSMPFQFKPSLPIAIEGKLPTSSASLANQLSTYNGNPGIVTTSNASTTTTVNTAGTNFGVSPAHGQPGHRCDVSAGAPLGSPAINTANMNSQISQPVTASQAIPSTAKATAAGLNPAHGQPGHRCDLSVGAPMVSPAINAANTKSQISQPVTTSQPIPSTAKATAAGLNPAHGQPGHRCDISVGAPLSSPATAATTASNTTTVTPATNQVTTSSANAVLPAVNPVNTADKNVKLNPAHGQPGHDCSILVGQPLKK